MFTAALLLFALGAPALLRDPSPGPLPQAAPAPRRLGKKAPPPDNLYPDIYDGKFHQTRMESLGTPEFEAVNMLEREAQLDELGSLVRQFKRAMNDARAVMDSRMDELETFMKE